MWAPHLNLALFPLHTLIHSLEMIPSQLVGLQFMLWFESTPTLWPRDMKFAFSSIAHWIVWWLPDSMNMTWRTLFLATTSFRHWPSHERCACFPREHWNIVKLLPRRMYFLECCRLHFLENSQAYFAPFLARAHLTFVFGKTRRETKSIMHDAIKRIKSASARPELGTFFMGRRWR